MTHDVNNLIRGYSSNLDTFCKFYPIVITGIASASVPTRAYITLKDFEYFYCTGIMASFDSSTKSHSPLMKVIDKGTGRNLMGTPDGDGNTSNTSGYVPIQGFFTPALQLQQAQFVQSVEYFFSPQSQIEIDVLNSGTGGTRVLSLLFYGVAFREVIV